jgi:hypothetical protein
MLVAFPGCFAQPRSRCCWQYLTEVLVGCLLYHQGHLSAPIITQALMPGEALLRLLQQHVY